MPLSLPAKLRSRGPEMFNVLLIFAIPSSPRERLLNSRVDPATSLIIDETTSKVQQGSIKGVHCETRTWRVLAGDTRPEFRTFAPLSCASKPVWVLFREVHVLSLSCPLYNTDLYACMVGTKVRDVPSGQRSSICLWLVGLPYPVGGLWLVAVQCCCCS